MSKKMDMLHGSILDKIFMFAIPVAITGVLQQLFNSSDAAVVGRFCNSAALAGVGTNGPVINIVINILVGLSLGANVVVASHIGRGTVDKIQNAVHTSMALSIIAGFIALFFGEAGARYVLEWIQTPPDVIEYATTYLRIYLLGLPFITAFNFGAALLRSTGDTKRPLYALLVAGTVNLVLNLFFVCVCGWGIAGVAIATVISNVLSCGTVIYFLTKDDGYLHLDLKKIRVDGKELKEILRIGIPSGLQGTVFSVANVAIQYAINSFGPKAIAGSSVCLNYELLNYYVIASFTQAAVTFTSQNFAAGQYARARKILYYIMSSAIGIVFITSMANVMFADAAINVFTDDAEAAAFAKTRMWIIIAPYIISVIYEVLCATLRGMGYANLPTVLMIIGICIFRLVWLATLQQWNNTYETLCAIYPCSWLFTDAMLIAAYVWVSKKIKEA
ncbi:MAG: MATE family efflux transporter [Phascolarctobacterium sp.]|nr:MATE family efflux transporter [Phascolarctobacterium sp.]